MLRNFLKTAFRNLWKNKTYSFINILGLTLGLSCFLLIALYVFDELTFDRFHKNAANIYRVVETKTSSAGKESKVAAVAYKISEQSPLSIPGIKTAARLSAFGRSNISDPDSINVFYETMYLANQEFLNVFDFKMVDGNRATALVAPRSAMITEELAKKLFGITSVAGKTIRIESDSLPYTITGVLANFPSHSHLSFNLVLSESSLAGQRYRDFIASDWNSNTYLSYLLLDKSADIKQTTEKLNKLVASNRDMVAGEKASLSLQPLADVHFHSADIDGTAADKKGNLSYIYIFSFVAIFVLLIACINYMNLTTARFSSRGKEIAVRKVAGAGRRSLISQFLSEAFVMAFIALIIALTITWLVLPAFNKFTGKELSLNLQTDYRVWLGIFISVILVGFFAGAYPALFQSRLKPLSLLKNKFQPGKGQLSLRKGLVVFQFSLSIIMIIATLVVFLQMKYVNTADMGFNREQLVVVDINSGTVRRGAQTVKDEFSKIAGVKSVSITSRVPGEWKVLPKVSVLKQGSNMQKSDVYFMAVDESFLKTFETELVAGRNFVNSPADSSAVIINETAAKLLGITSPSEQIIEIPTIDFSGNISNLNQPFHARIVGISKDFNFRSLREKIAPLILAYQQNPVHNIDYFTARLASGNVEQVLSQMKAVLANVDQQHLFEYNFLDKQWEIFYREDKKRQTIFLAVAILTILIACLGLFGLATYAAEQRIKEIGVRKVLGANVLQLISLLTKEFVKLVMIAAFIAMPVAWWMMNNWLKDFAYRTTLYWWIFVIAGVVALSIAVVTVGVKAFKSAVLNPIKSLRTE